MPSPHQKELDLTLTNRDSGREKRMPMISFPYHRCDEYFNKIREMHDFTVIENETEHTSYTHNLYINKQTGEVLDVEKDEQVTDTYTMVEENEFGIRRTVRAAK